MGNLIRCFGDFSGRWRAHENPVQIRGELKNNLYALKPSANMAGNENKNGETGESQQQSGVQSRILDTGRGPLPGTEHRVFTLVLKA